MSRAASDPGAGGDARPARGAKTAWRTLRVVMGLTLVALGVIGMLLPVIPGVPLVIAGVALLGANHPWVRPFMARLRLWRRRRKRSG